jgi:LuxR family maltose regulon positive regulatory protein
MYRSGRAATLERWFEWFETQGAVGEYAPLAVLVAWVRATTGAAADAARWADAAERAPAESPVFDGSPSIETWLSVLRALQCVHGVAQMRVDAERAARELPRTSFWHPTALALLGTAETLTGESGEAHLREALEAAESTGFHPNACFCLSQLGALAASHGDWATTRDLVARARALIDEARLDDYWASGLVHALGARLAVRRGAASEASADLVRAQRLRSVLTHAIPWFAVQVRLELIRAHLGLADPAGARTLLREIDDILRRRSDLGTLSEHVEDVRRQVIAQPAGTAGASSLSAAELRLLPYLHTHLSFREIARRLFLSPNTVKTQAISLYRKLGVSSRGEAMTRAEELGLIDG